MLPFYLSQRLTNRFSRPKLVQLARREIKLGRGVVIGRRIWVYFLRADSIPCFLKKLRLRRDVYHGR